MYQLMVFNSRICMSCQFLIEWKMTCVTAVHEKGSKKSCCNYRIICLLSYKLRFNEASHLFIVKLQHSIFITNNTLKMFYRTWLKIRRFSKHLTSVSHHPVSIIWQLCTQVKINLCLPFKPKFLSKKGVFRYIKH